MFRKHYPQYSLTAFLRSTALDEALNSLDIAIVHGTFSDLSTIEELSSTHDIIINCAASFNPPVTEAILRGIRRTQQTPKKKPILLHVSGAGNFIDHSTTGEYIPQSSPFNDANAADVRKINASYPPNGATDEIIFQAAARGEVNALFVCPGAIYGNSTNHIGLTVRAASAQAPGVWLLWNMENIEAAGFSPYVGPGTSVFRFVHVDDVVDLMILVFRKALETWDSYVPEDIYRHFYLAVDEELPSKPVAMGLADLVYRRGGIAEPVVRSVSFEEAGKVAG